MCSNSDTSAPTLKSLPAPVKIIARTPASRPSSSNMVFRARHIASVIALRFVGRLRVTTARPLSHFTMMSVVPAHRSWHSPSMAKSSPEFATHYPVGPLFPPFTCISRLMKVVRQETSVMARDAGHIAHDGPFSFGSAVLVWSRHARWNSGPLGQFTLDRGLPEGPLAACLILRETGRRIG